MRGKLHVPARVARVHACLPPSATAAAPSRIIGLPVQSSRAERPLPGPQLRPRPCGLCPAAYTLPRQGCGAHVLRASHPEGPLPPCPSLPIMYTCSVTETKGVSEPLGAEHGVYVARRHAPAEHEHALPHVVSSFRIRHLLHLQRLDVLVHLHDTHTRWHKHTPARDALRGGALRGAGQGPRARKGGLTVSQEAMKSDRRMVV
jgi:hypothetical protein